MKEVNKKRLLEVFAFLFVFGCMLLMTFSIFPKVDEHIFCVSVKWDFDSVIRYILNYGNGRFLGNLICIFFSHYYKLKFILVSFIITSLTYIIYKAFFKGKVLFIIPLAILVFFPSKLMNDSVFLDFPSFVNYVVPMLFISITLLALKNYDSNRLKHLKLFVIGINTVLACLFSENTTIIIVVLAVFSLVIKKISKDKNFFGEIVFLISSLLGSLIMYLIPILTGTSHKLDSYHAMTFSPKDLFANMMLASNIINEFVFVFSIISVSLTYIVLKNNKSTFFDWVCITILHLYIFLSLSIKSFESNVFTSVIIMLSTAVYLLAVFSIVIRFFSKRLRLYLSALILISMESVAQMVFINILSYRCFYATYYLVLIFALILVNEVFKEQLLKYDLPKLTRATTIVNVCFLLLFSIIQCESTIRSFDVYVLANERQKTLESQTFDEKFGSGFNFEIITYAFENRKYYNPTESVIWPRENWNEIFR